jgi:hypothetical protein
MANPREARAEIQRILEDFTRGTIDFQSLLTELDETFKVDASARTLALELVDELDPNGALQRGFFRVLKDRIEQNLATGAPIPIVSHPRSANAVEAVLQKDLPLEERTVPFGRASEESDAEARHAEDMSAVLAAGATVPMRGPEPEATPIPAESATATVTPAASEPGPPVEPAGPAEAAAPAPAAEPPPPPPDSTLRSGERCAR